MHDDGLELVGAGMGEAAPWITIGIAGLIGFGALAGWTVRTAWAVGPPDRVAELLPCAPLTTTALTTKPVTALAAPDAAH